MFPTINVQKLALLLMKITQRLTAYQGMLQVSNETQSVKFCR